MLQLKCIASNRQTNGNESRSPPTAFSNAKWSPDGTSLLATTTDNQFQTYIVPPDLLTNSDHHHLQAYSSWQTASSIIASAVYPFYSLSSSDTTLVLTSTRDHPIQLCNALDYSAGPVASYPCVNQQTESIYANHSLTFTTSGSHFVAGSDSLLSIYDTSRSGEEPVQQLPTIPSKRDKRVGGGVGIKGIISSLSISADGTLAAGMFSRKIGLYGDEGRGEMISVFEVDLADPSKPALDIGGTGITQVVWSPCARYLYAVLRKSDVVLVYDIRVTGRRLAWLTGRKAKTNQRLNVDVVQTADGHEIWGGGVDGAVRVWKNPGEIEGPVEPWVEWAGHDDPVVASVVHQSGSVFASFSAPSRTASSDCEDLDSSANDSTDSENNPVRLERRVKRSQANENQSPTREWNSLKIWSIHRQTVHTDSS